MNGAHLLTLEVVAECFDVRVDWLALVCELRLVRAVHERGAWRVEVTELERVARIVRLCVHQGVELEFVSVLID